MLVCVRMYKRKSTFFTNMQQYQYGASRFAVVSDFSCYSTRKRLLQLNWIFTRTSKYLRRVLTNHFKPLLKMVCIFFTKENYEFDFVLIKKIHVSIKHAAVSLKWIMIQLGNSKITLAYLFDK